MTHPRSRLRALLLTLTLTSAARAEWKGTYLLPGPHVGLGHAAGGAALSVGAEVSAVAWSRHEPLLGAWAQFGRMLGEANLWRAAAGLEVGTTIDRGKGGGVGLEVGASRLWLDDGRRGHTLALAPFYSLGVATLSFRTGVPLDATARSLGFEGSLVATFKYPFLFGEPGPSFNMLR